MTKKLSVFSLTLITVCSVDSIRNLPAAAMAGNQLFNYFTLSLLFFLLPCAIIACWFSPQSQQGLYGWIKNGTGKRTAFMAIWFQCVQNVLVYPTLLSFIAGAMLYSISPDLSENRLLIFCIVSVLIWGLTWINLKGIQTSSRFNSFCSTTGIFIPFTLILLMGLYWWLTQTHAGVAILPTAVPYSWTALTAITLSFSGIELAAVHARESEPGAFPKAVIISVIVVFLSMVFGSITLAMIIPADQLNFISSVPQLIQLFFGKMHCDFLAAPINILIAIGCIGAANNWLIVPIKGLGFAAAEGALNAKFTQLNKNQVPATLLIHQACYVTLISSLFLVVPALNASYWIMLNSATQILLLTYVLLFISAIKIVQQTRETARFKILITSGIGLFGLMISLLVSLTPPPSLQFTSKSSYAFYGCLFLIAVVTTAMWGSRGLKKVVSPVSADENNRLYY